MLTDINNVPIDQAIKENGFVIVGNLIPEEMFPKLREACDRVVDRARKHDWPHRYSRLPNVTSWFTLTFFFTIIDLDVSLASNFLHGMMNPLIAGVCNI